MRGEWSLLKEYMKREIEKSSVGVQTELKKVKTISCQADVAKAEASCQADVITKEWMDSGCQKNMADVLEDTTIAHDTCPALCITESECQKTVIEDGPCQNAAKMTMNVKQAVRQWEAKFQRAHLISTGCQTSRPAIKTPQLIQLFEYLCYKSLI